MRKNGVALTRANYMALEYPDSEPENELELPPMFRRGHH
jgi:hypothetical protein